MDTACGVMMMEVGGSRAAGQSLRGRLSVGLRVCQPTTYLGAQGCESEDGRTLTNKMRERTKLSRCGYLRNHICV